MSEDSRNSVVNRHIVKAEFFLVDAVVHTVAKRSSKKFSRLFFGTPLTPDICMTSNGFTEKGPAVSPLVHAASRAEVINAGCLEAKSRLGAETSCCGAY